MKLRSAFWKVVHLVRLRKIWSQIGALLQRSGMNMLLLDVRQRTWSLLLSAVPGCRRRYRYRVAEEGGTKWTLQQAWGYLGPIVRRAAPLFKHLKRVYGQLRYRSVTRERLFRRSVIAQINANRWFSWTPEAHRAINILDQPI